jgi:hypothetical protein
MGRAESEVVGAHGARARARLAHGTDLLRLVAKGHERALP